MSEILGFVGAGRWRRVECDWLEPAEGAEPLWAEIRCDLTFGELEDIPLTDVTYGDLWTLISPLVRAWNVVKRNTVTGVYEPVPPPAEGGADSFRAADTLIGDWLAFAIKRSPFAGGPARPKDSPPSNATPDGENEPVSISAPPAKNRKSRKG